MESDAVARKMTTLTNRRQFEFNAEQLARVAELKPLLDSLSGKGLESAQALMLEIQTKFEKKQQLICIADAEGWLVANHFAGTDIVVTTEDKLKLKEAKKAVAGAGISQSTANSESTAWTSKSIGGGGSGGNRRKKVTTGFLGKCFKCGKAGHRKSDNKC